MASEVEICNAALTYLGDKLITSLTDNNNQARACNARYGMVRDAVTRAHPWNCAMHRVADQASEATAPVWEFTDSYVLPTAPHCLRVVEVRNYKPEEWIVEGRRLLISASPIDFRYLKRMDTSGDIDSTMVEAISARLAHSICIRLTNDEEKKRELWRTYKEILAEARTMNAFEGRAFIKRKSVFREVRGPRRQVPLY